MRSTLQRGRKREAGMSSVLKAAELLRSFDAPDLQQSDLRNTFLNHLMSGVQPLSRANSVAHFTASVGVLDPTASNALLIYHARLATWIQPGGHWELGDEDFAATAVREGREETGIIDLRLLTVRPVELDVHEATCRSRCLHYDVRFAAVTPADTIAGAGRWFRVRDLPRDMPVTTGRLIHRIRRQMLLRPAGIEANEGG